ncbi:toll/interleukin-1 receptor domain-containing protein [uncultured Erythrobacter sp.]|uniref:toll/interleukin-1 receptor domain-containing protein n=1 Tax=uncultured Erythrobacter sp. TaxID=263913 RepID=UPI00260433C1|nr:toll/interleukin-1 receptor domain-containing protein [uncultured Erythrobacter sp.]
MPDVFISYSRHDQEAVARLAKKVEAEGYDVWWDAELPPHKSYGDVITEKIGAAKAAIVVWSETAAASEWVRAEADVARNQKKLIQTALGDLIPPLPFNQIQFADIGDWQGEDDHSGWRKVMASLTELCGEREWGGAAAAASTTAAPAPSPAPPPPPPPPPPAPVAQASAPSKWPLFAGIGIAALAIVAVGAFMLGSLGSEFDEDFEPNFAEVGMPEPGPDPVPEIEDFAAPPEPEPAPTQDLSAAPRAGGSGGRRVACYFSNPMGVYDGACAFRSRPGGDFITTSLEGPYLMDINQVGLDVVGEGVGMLQIYSEEFGMESLPVTRSTEDRACWQGEDVIFCAR